MPTPEPQVTANSTLDEPAVRPERIVAMLARWRSEDVSDEPDWDVRDAQRLRLRQDSPRVGDES